MRAYGVFLLLALVGAQNSGTIDTKTPTVTATPFDRTGSDGGGMFEISASVSPKPATINSDVTMTPSMMGDSSSTGGNRMSPSATMFVEMSATPDISPEPSVRDTTGFQMSAPFTPRHTLDFTPEPSKEVLPTWKYSPRPTYEFTPYPSQDTRSTKEYTPHPTYDHNECICDGTAYPTRYIMPSYDYTPYPSDNNWDTTWPTHEFTPYPSNADWDTSSGDATQMSLYPTRGIWCPCMEHSMMPSLSAWPSKPPVDTFTARPSFSAKPTIRTDFETARPSFTAMPTIKTDDMTMRPSFSSKPTVRTDFETLRPSFSAKPTIRTDFETLRSPIPTFLSVSLRPSFIAIPTRFPPIDNRTKELIAEIIKTREELQSIITGVRGGDDFNVSRAQQFVADIANTFNSVSQVATGVRDSIDEVQDSFRRIGTIVLGVNKSAVFETRTLNFTLRAAAVEDDKKQEVRTDAGSIQLPVLPFRNQSISVVEWKDNPFRAISSREIASNVITIMLSDLRSGNETRVAGLTEAINITLPLRGFNFSSFKPVCVYWDKIANEWSSDGCVVKEVRLSGVVCGCTHLTDFSVLSTPIANNGITGGDVSSGVGGSGGGNTGSSLNVSNLPIIIGGAIGGLMILSIIIAFIVYRAKDKKGKILTPIPVGVSVINYLHNGNPSAYSVAGGRDSYMIGPMARNKSVDKISYKPNVIGGLMV
jgi:hypothetical protein